MIKRNDKAVLIIAGAIILVGIAITAFLYGKSFTNPLISQEASNDTQTHFPTSKETANWKTYTNTTYNVQFKYPQDIFVYQGVPSNDAQYWSNKVNGAAPLELGIDGVWLNIGFASMGNTFNFDKYLSELETKSAYAKVSDLPTIDAKGALYHVGIPEGSAGEPAYSYEAIWLKGDVLYTLSLSTFKDMTLAKYKVTFDQILSTFKFLNTNITPEPTMAINPAKKLTYALPSGWETVRDASGTFEVGYDPDIYHTAGTDSITNLSVSVTRNNEFGGYYTVSIQPYGGGSRHTFILGQYDTDYKSPDYHEKNYSFAGMSCLVLYGVDISQWPPIEGMCAINSARAFRFALPQMDDSKAEQILSTIKLLK